MVSFSSMKPKVAVIARRHRGRRTRPEPFQSREPAGARIRSALENSNPSRFLDTPIPDGFSPRSGG